MIFFMRLTIDAKKLIKVLWFIGAWYDCPKERIGCIPMFITGFNNGINFE